MQLDVLSVLQLPSTQRAQSGPFVLQEDGDLTLKDYHEQQRRVASWPRNCTLFSCSRQARYADEADGEAVQFALVRECARPSTWVLLADVEGNSSSIRVEQVRGHHALHTVPPAPSCLPYDNLTGLGLPPTFAKDDVLPDGSLQPLSTASSFRAHRPCTKLETYAPPHLVAHAYWKRSYPGLLVIAAAYDHESQQLDTEHGKLALSANRCIAADPADSAADGDVHQVDGQLQWQWHVLQISSDLGYVGPVVARADVTVSTPSPGSGTGPVLETVRMAWDAQGDVLAVSIVDSDSSSCVFALHVRNQDVLWNTPWQLVGRPSGEADRPSAGSHIAAMSWLCGSWLLAVVDDSGTLCMLDARNHGQPKAAALLCGDIKYGEVAHVRLGPILENPAPQLSPGFAASNLVARLPSNTHRRRGRKSGGCMRGGGSRAQSDHRHPGLLAGGNQLQQQQQQQPKAQFSLASSAIRGVSFGTQTASSPVMAVCNGSAVVLLRLLLPDEPATPTAHAAFQSGGGSMFGWLHKTPESAAAGTAGAALALNGSLNRTADLLVVPRPSSCGARLRAESQLERSSSLGTSAVSTPYMLGLQSAGGSQGPTPIATCQSTVSEALVPSWPLTWRTLLTLPLPGSPSPGQCPPGTSATATGQWSRVISHNTANAHTGAYGVHSPPMAPSSAAHVTRGAGFPSPAPSTATLLETPASALGGLWARNGSASCSCFPERSSRGGTEDGASERQANAATVAGDGPIGRTRRSVSPPPGDTSSVEAGLVCAAPAAVQALQAGDVLVLRGNMVEALRHYPRAHVFGFLPAFLVLVHLHRINAAGQLLRAYARFTGRLAAAVTAVSKPPTAPDAGGNEAPSDQPVTPPSDISPTSAFELQQQWQTTMTDILDAAVSEQSHGTHFPAPSPAPGAAMPVQLNGMGADSALCFTPPASPTLDTFSLQAPGLSPSPSGTADRVWDTSASGPLSLVGASQQPQAQQQQHDRMSATGMASVPEEAVLEVVSVRPPLPEQPTAACWSGEISPSPPQAAVAAAVVVAPGDGERPPRPSSIRIGDEQAPSKDGKATGVGEGPPVALTDMTGQAEGGLACEPGQAGSGSEVSDGLHTADFVSPGEALRDMLRACLQLLLLACQAMAFLAFSAYSAGRAEAAAAAVDVSALPLSPASPRSPGGSVLSRQAMRRLSSTMRMRSLRTRSVSTYGNTGGHGGPHTGSPPSQQPPVLPISTGAPTGTAQSRAEPSPATSPLNGGGALSRAPSVVPPGISCTRNSGTGPGAAATAPRPPVPVPAVVIGFPIPVVWQPQPMLHHTAQHPLHHQHHQRHHQPHSPGWTESPSSANSPGGVAPHSNQHPTASLFSSQPPDPAAATTAGPTLETSISLVESGQASSPVSPPNPGTIMRLQLHHCAFDAARLWTDVSGQPTPISGQTAATQYLKPSYAAGLLLMAHACSVQLRQLQQPHQQHRALHGNAAEDVSQRAEIAEDNRGGSGGEQQLEAIAVAGDEAGRGANTGAQVAEVNGHMISTWRAEDLRPSTQPPQQLPHSQHQHPDRRHTKPQRKRSAAHAGGPYGGGLHSPYKHHHHHAGNLLRGGSGTGGARVNWQLLRASATATQAAAVWQSLNDWHRAALLVFACASALTQLGGGTADLPLEAANGRRRRRSVSVTKIVPRSAEREELGRTESGDNALAAAAANGGGNRDGDGILAAARASCLRMGQRVLMSQVAACQKMEVQDACSVLLELVALPRRLLGLHSTVHVSLLQKVCSRVVGLLPARVCITPLLPAGPVPPLLQLSHAGIRAQLVAHCGATVARVLEELRLAATCGGAFVSMREAVQQIAEHTMVDSCVRMLLRWQGSYDGSRVDTVSARLPEAVADMLLLPDTPDWSPEAVLPTLQEAFVVSGLMSVTDAAAVVKAAAMAAATALEAAAVTPHRGSGTGALPSLAPTPAAMATARKPSPGGAAGPAVSELQDLDELALMLDLSQLQHTLLAALQPFLHDALLRFRFRPPSLAAGGADITAPKGGQLSDSAAGVATRDESATAGSNHQHVDGREDGGRGGGWWVPQDEEEEEEDEEVLGDPNVLAALAPVDLTTWCLKLLLKLQWALYCRAQVCALMLQLVQLQASPPAPPSSAPIPVKPKSGTDMAPDISTAISISIPTTAIPIPQPSALRDKPPGPSTISPRSRHSDGRQSFQDFIQSRASNTASAPPLSVQHAANTPPTTPGRCSGGAAVSSVDCKGAAGAATDQQHTLLPAAGAEEVGTQIPNRHPAQQPQPQQPQQAVESVAQSLPCGVSEHGQQDGRARGCPQEAISEAGCLLLTREEDLETVQGALMAWTAALVRADKFHSPSELQGCTLTVLNMVRSCPLQLVTELDKALERRAIRNKSIAMEVRRLQRAAPPAPAAPPPGTTHDNSAAAATAAPGAAPGAAAHPTEAQRAVMLVQADIQAATLNLLEYFADPTGALPSGLSGHAVGDGGGSPPRVTRISAASGHSSGGGPGSDTEGGIGSGGPTLPATKAATWHGCFGATASPPRLSQRPRHGLCGSRSVSCATSHNTLLQCLVCELVRNSHSVTASVSWRATLEGGRGLAGCFVHPIIHGDSGGRVGGGGSRASVVETTRGLAVGKPPVGHVPLSATMSALCDDVEGLSNAPTAEGAQELLLSLMDVGQWAATPRPTTLGGAIVGIEGSSAALASSSAGGDSLHGHRRRSTGGRLAAMAAGAVVSDDLDNSSRMGRTGSPQRTRMARKDLMAAGVVAWRCNGHHLMGGIGTDVDTDSEARDERRSARSVNGGAACSSPGSPSRLSFSGLTDGGTDCTYPAAPGTATSDGRTPADRPGNSSMRRHNNPAFGLHSPTPSNLSEAWEDGSDMTSPRSTQLNTGVETSIGGAAVGRVDSRPGTAEGRAYSAWKAGGFGGGVGAAGHGACPQTPRDQAGMPVPTVYAPVVDQRRGGVLARDDDAASGDGGGGGKDNQKGTENNAGLTTVGDGDTEGDQPPTLSYLLNVNALDEIRNAVRQAHEEDADTAVRPNALSAVQSADSGDGVKTPPLSSLRIPLTESSALPQQNFGSPDLQREPLRTSVSEVNVRGNVPTVQSSTVETGSSGLVALTHGLTQIASAVSPGSTAQGQLPSPPQAGESVSSSDPGDVDGAVQGGGGLSASTRHVREDIQSPSLPRAQTSPLPSPPSSPLPPKQQQQVLHRLPRPPSGTGGPVTRGSSFRAPNSPLRPSSGRSGGKILHADGISSDDGGGGGGGSQNGSSPSRPTREPPSPNGWSVASSISLVSPRALRAVSSSNALSPPSTPAMSPLPTDVTLLHPPSASFIALHKADRGTLLPVFPAQARRSNIAQPQQPDLNRLGLELFPQTTTTTYVDLFPVTSAPAEVTVLAASSSAVYDMPSAFDRPARSPSLIPTDGRGAGAANGSTTAVETVATVPSSGQGSSDIQINDFLRIPHSMSKSVSDGTSTLGSFPSEFFQTPTSSQPTETPSLTSMPSQPLHRKTSAAQSTFSPSVVQSPQHQPPAPPRGTDAVTQPTTQLPPTTSLLSPYSSGAFSSHSSLFGNAAFKGRQSSSLIPGRNNVHNANPRQGSGGPPGSSSGAAANTRQPPTQPTQPTQSTSRHTGGIPSRPGATTGSAIPVLTTSRPSVSMMAAPMPSGPVPASGSAAAPPGHHLPGAQRAGAVESAKLRSLATVPHAYHYNTSTLGRNADQGGSINARRQPPVASGGPGGRGGGSTPMSTTTASGIHVAGGKGPHAHRDPGGRQSVPQQAGATPAESLRMRRQSLDVSQSGGGASQGGAVNPLFNANAAVALGTVEREVAWGSPRLGGGRGSGGGGGGSGAGSSTPGGVGARTQYAKTSSFDQRRPAGSSRGVWH